jgi:hypothetical protein
MGLFTLLASAASEGSKHADEAHSYTLFYVVGGVVAGLAVLISVVGFMRPEFPRGKGTTNALMAAGAVCCAGAMAAALYVTA